MTRSKFADSRDDVAADAGSVYEPHPSMSLEWDPGAPRTQRRSASISQTMRSTSIAPMGVEVSGSLPPVLPDGPVSYNGHTPDGPTQVSPLVQRQVVPGHEIWVYNSGET